MSKADLVEICPVIIGPLILTGVYLKNIEVPNYRKVEKRAEWDCNKTRRPEMIIEDNRH